MNVRIKASEVYTPPNPAAPGQAPPPERRHIQLVDGETDPTVVTRLGNGSLVIDATDLVAAVPAGGYVTVTIVPTPDPVALAAAEAAFAPAAPAAPASPAPATS